MHYTDGSFTPTQLIFNCNVSQSITSTEDNKNIRGYIRDFCPGTRRSEKQLIFHKQPTTEAAIKGILCKKVFLEISQNSQENTCARAWGLQLY